MIKITKGIADVLTNSEEVGTDRLWRRRQEMSTNEQDKIKETIERLNQILNSDYLDGVVSYWQDKSACQIFKADIHYLISTLQKEELDVELVIKVMINNAGEEIKNCLTIMQRIRIAQAICQQFKPKQFEREKVKKILGGECQVRWKEQGIWNVCGHPLPCPKHTDITQWKNNALDQLAKLWEFSRLVK